MKTINEKVQEYLTKTSLHLFFIPNPVQSGVEVCGPVEGKLIKIIPITLKDGKSHALVLRFCSDDNSLKEVRSIDIDRLIQYNGGNTKCILKHSLFGAIPNPKNHAIKNRKTIKLQIEEIKKMVVQANNVVDKVDFKYLLEGKVVK